MERTKSDSYATPLMWVGALRNTRSAIRKHIIDIVASCKGCTKCHFCYSLRTSMQTRTYSAPPCVVWLTPREHGYVREQIDEALAVLAVMLDTHESSAFVIESADQLHSSAANRLLKVIEEPPVGWHICFTTERPTEVLPTLRSRCIERVASSEELQKNTYDMVVTPYEGLPPEGLLWLENPQAATWLEMCSKTDTLPRTVPATLNAFNGLIKLWHTRWIGQSDPRAHTVLAILTEMAENPPASGGTAGFWRVLLTRIYQAL